MALPDNIELGEGSFLHSSFAFLHFHSERDLGFRLGNHSSVYEATWFALGPRGSVEIGEYCMLWSNLFCVNSRVVIGDHVLISGECYIADSFAPVPPDDPLFFETSASDDEPSVVIGDNCWIGIRSTLLRGARLGEGVIVGAGSVVDFEVPPFAIVAGNPAKVVGWASA